MRVKLSHWIVAPARPKGSRRLAIAISALAVLVLAFKTWSHLPPPSLLILKMIRSMPAFITASVLGASNYIPSAMALWPNPTSLTTGEQYLKLSPSFTIEFVSGNPPSDLFDAMSRTKAQIKNDKHQRLIVGRGDADAPHLEAANFLEKLTLQLDGEDEGHGVVKSIMENIIVDAEAKDESYRLQVPADGSSATLVANNTLGLFRGLTTFSQLFYLSGSTIYTYNTPLNIEDKAAFPHRGVLLDTARNYLPKADILRTLDAMSWTKFNVLHWHVVDSQSFPLEVAAFPELSRAGAYDASSVYTVSDVKEIVNYAGA
ncbi:N-acetyl-glucosamine-6-phosphate deacetylase, partial [Tulasnella sp. 403]